MRLAYDSDGYRLISNRAVERLMPDGRTLQVYVGRFGVREAREVLAAVK